MWLPLALYMGLDGNWGAGIGLAMYGGLVVTQIDNLVRMVMQKPDGSSTDEMLGTGTGRQQMFILQHYAKEETITLKQGTQPIDRANWSYDPVNKIITVIALKDSAVTATYQWTAETPEIIGYVAAWNQ